jgi:hypothetical protein
VENRKSFGLLGIHAKHHTELKEKLAKTPVEWAASLVRHTHQFRAKHERTQTQQRKGGD